MRAAATLALALVLPGCVSTGTYRQKEAEASRLQQELEDESARRAVLQERLRALQVQLDNLLADLNSVKERSRSDEDALAQKESELRAARLRVVEMQALVDELSKSKRRLEAAKAELEKRSAEYEQLASALRGEIDSGRVELMELRGRTTVKMNDRILFASGSATIGADGREALRKVSQALRAMQGRAVRVEGHTDNVPTNPAGAFPTNWELSSARALAVVRFLQENGLDPTRLSGSGFGEYQPVATNQTPEGRSQNRRIEIVLVPLEGAAPIPAPPASKS
jgi:chemotaxis protein MotB